MDWNYSEKSTRNICLKYCIPGHTTDSSPMSGQGERTRAQRRRKPIIDSFDGWDWMVCTRTLRKPSQYAFEGSREAPSSDGLSGSSNWGYNWLLYSTRGVSPVAYSPEMNWIIMAKSKGVRIVVTLECTECRTATAAEKRRTGVSRYTTTKNRRNNPERLELMKFCPQLNRMTLHREIK